MGWQTVEGSDKLSFKEYKQVIVNGLYNRKVKMADGRIMTRVLLAQKPSPHGVYVFWKQTDVNQETAEGEYVISHVLFADESEYGGTGYSYKEVSVSDEDTRIPLKWLRNKNLTEDSVWVPEGVNFDEYLKGWIEAIKKVNTQKRCA